MLNRFSVTLAAAVVLGLGPNRLVASDWPSWLGPELANRTAVAGGFDADLAHWDIAWKAKIGFGYSPMSVLGAKGIILGHDGKSEETVFCFDAATGAVVWKHSCPAELLPRMHPGGPNAMATIHGDQVVTVGKDGLVLCLGLATGDVVWSARLTEVLGVKLPQWGFASSPVVLGDRLLLSGGKVVALDLKTGKPVWVSATEQHPGYSTPTVFTQGGTTWIAVLDGKGVSIHAAADGREAARQVFKSQFDMNASTPFAIGDGRVLVSGGSRSELFEFDGAALKSIWHNDHLKNAMGNGVLVDGVVYGIDGKQGDNGSRLVAMSVEDGRELWGRPDFGFGTVTGVGDTLLALTESGELVSARLVAAKFVEISRKQVLGKTCWTQPVFAGGRIYVRNDKGDLACLSRK
jgi:outer membrane protein assembly factor BamB